MDVARFLRGEVANICSLLPSEVADDVKLVAIGLDSVRLVDLIIGVEEEFDIVISELDPRLGAVQTFQELVDYVVARVAE